MQLRTFTADRLSDALAVVRRELGPNAVIVHTREYRQGGVFGFGARRIVEVTAADGRQIGQQRRLEAQQQRTPRPATLTKPTAPTTNGSAGDLIRRTYAAAMSQRGDTTASNAVQSLAGSAQSASSAGTTASIAPTMPNASAGTGTLTAPPQAHESPINVKTRQLADEMSAVKHMVSRMFTCQQRRLAKTDLPETLFGHYLTLLEQEVADELAQDIVRHVSQSLDQEQLNDASAVRSAVLDQIVQLIPADADPQHLERSPDGGPFTIALIGPTGVGKTTTIAKLAAGYKLKHKRDVALVTMDTYRIAAVDQLQTYAGIIGVPLHVVTSPADMLEVKARCAHHEVVLIDTAGRSQRDHGKLEQLDSLLTAADPNQVHLVLSSACAQSVMMQAVDRFSQIRTDRVIFTKLDEAVTLGVLLNVTSKINKRLSFFTTGQDVPNEIEPGRPERIGELLLGQTA
ncbi:MAG: flagellar biosynthesis protein FlhF [Phycisphaeraceae bacterium]|jgi:flagellar biosynthesis protein FlhF|nr:flagellar biosynthesis protein FlhF [Phycisphaeraceae bacterium]